MCAGVLYVSVGCHRMQCLMQMCTRDATVVPGIHAAAQGYLILKRQHQDYDNESKDSKRPKRAPRPQGPQEAEADRVVNAAVAEVA